jgi:hypothetical protein
MRKVGIASLLALCSALAVAPASAEVFTLTLTNGSTFDSRYQPRQAIWDATMIEFLTETGNWMALPKSLVSDIAAASETKGFGRVIDTTTVDLGFAPNDMPTEDAAAGNAAGDLPQVLERSYDQQQFVEPGSMGGGIPVGNVTGFVDGGGSRGRGGRN